MFIGEAGEPHVVLSRRQERTVGVDVTTAHIPPIAGRIDATLRAADTLCAAEPIHIPGSIQPHGIAVAADPALRVVAASEGAAGLLGVQAPTCLGLSVEAVLGGGYAEALRDRLSGGEIDSASPWVTVLTPGNLGVSFEVGAHRHDGLVIIELLPLQGDDGIEALHAARELQRSIAALREGAGSDLLSLARITVRGIRRLTGYERVLVYRFDAEWHGQAIAEDRVEDWEQSLDGLHFPASDIPAQARALYRRNPMRWVPASRARPLPLEVDPGWGRPIDLSFARLRSLSPVHLQYHRNMGVEGSMSVSIMHRGELWGLLVCHHRAAHYPSPGQRAAAVSLTDAFALRIETAERAGREHARQADARRYAALVAHMAEADDVGAALTDGETTIASLFDAAGAAVRHDGALRLLGRTPPAEAVGALADWLAGRAESELFHSNHLGALYPPWEAHAAEASGLLAVFLSADRRDVLLWFRPEETKLVAWGGNPNKPLDDPGEREFGQATLPRASFERWIEERHGYARPWEDWALEIAASLRHAITEVIVRSLRRIAALQERLHQSQKMEAVGQLTGGLAHDFNNLLTGIIGSLELCRKRVEQGRTAELDRFITAALGEAARAGALTRRLLAFSRNQPIDPARTDLKSLIEAMQELILRTITSAITMQVSIAPALWPVFCDANQFENALLNLAINARDAMPQGGRLSVEAINASFAAEALPGLAAGDYVVVSVGDTGAGMRAEVAARAFEPFFSTKPLGQGTGLGLSMVYGFARQSSGHARIYSEEGVGTTIHLYLPRAADPA